MTAQTAASAGPSPPVLPQELSPVMPGEKNSEWPKVQRAWANLILRSAVALLASAAALLVWFLWPVMHDDPFVVFVAAVVVVARFAGFGPALLCTASSACALSYFVFRPAGFPMSQTDADRLAAFVAASVLVAGLARQRSRAESKAGEAREQMVAIVESSEDAILSTTRDGVITSWNRGAEKLYGYSAQEAIGRHISFVAPPERTFEIAQHTAKLIRGEYIESYQTERMRKDGSRVSVMLSISPLRDRRGAIVGSSAIGRDVTGQRRAEEALRRNERLATAGRLAATIAHEINNPLEAVTNLLYLARHDPDRHEKHLQMAEREVERIAHIARQTLGFVREASTTTPIVVAEIVDEVLQLYARKVQQRRIQILKQFDYRVCVEGYPGELRQLFSNLINNAIEAMNDGGQLQLRIAHSHERRAEGKTGARITVADNGTGINQADLPHLFEPFYTTKKDTGTGLGLWLVHGIVQKHHGMLRVHSSTKPGQRGTVFSVFLPSVPEAAKPDSVTQDFES